MKALNQSKFKCDTNDDNWCALFISIVRDKSSEESLDAMGVIINKINKGRKKNRG